MALLAMAAAACEAQTDIRGNFPDPDALAEIKPGVHTRTDVTRLLGAPSTVATFSKETWYYIGGRVKTVAFFKPEILERQVLTVNFDAAGRVTTVEKVDATKTKKIVLVDRETPTKGKELTILQQLIGNIGRFGNRDDGGTR
ncbi:MAG: outer membrane protein assembly factor BamE [Alphaproteobacteria bacterium]